MSFKQVMTASGDGTAHVWQAAVLPESLGGEHQIMLSNKPFLHLWCFWQFYDLTNNKIVGFANVCDYH